MRLISLNQVVKVQPVDLHQMGRIINERIKKFRTAIETMHKCKALHERSIVLFDMFKFDTVQVAVVEAFSLTGHPRAKRCFAWSHQENGETQFINVLEIPPVSLLKTGTRAAVRSKAKKKK